MPTYVYRCRKGHTFEVFHSISDDSPRRCPECRGVAKRVPAGGAGLLFKGSGFYITDYRSKGYEESAKRESGAAGTKPSAGSESSPAAPKPEKSPAPGTSGSREGSSSGRKRKGAGGGRPRGAGGKSDA